MKTRKKINSVSDARNFLLVICNNRFKDKTFENYIESKLAGDFAVEIANVMTADEDQANRLYEYEKNNERVYKGIENWLNSLADNKAKQDLAIREIRMWIDSLI